MMDGGFTVATRLIHGRQCDQLSGSFSMHMVCTIVHLFTWRVGGGVKMKAGLRIHISNIVYTCMSFVLCCFWFDDCVSFLLCCFCWRNSRYKLCFEYFLWVDALVERVLFGFTGDGCLKPWHG